MNHTSDKSDNQRIVIQAEQFKLMDVLSKGICSNVFFRLARYTDGNKRFLYVSDNVYEYLGLKVSDILADYTLPYAQVLPAYLDELEQHEQKSYETLLPFEFEFEFMVPDGEIKWLSIKSVPEKLKDGTVVWDGIQADITHLKRKELQQAKANKELQILNAVNDIILQSQNPAELYEQTARCLIQIGHYRLAWFSLSPDEQDKSGMLQPLAACGAVEYLDEIRIDIHDPKHSKGPIATAIRTGQMVVINNVHTSAAFRPWQAIARKFGIAAILVIPYRVDGRTHTLNIYAASTDAFDAHETQIFIRIARNLERVMQVFRDRQKSDLVNLLLEKRVRELDVLSLVYEVLHKEHSMDAALGRIVEILPSGWQQTGECHILIDYNGTVFENGRRYACSTSLEENIQLNNGDSITIKVTYPADVFSVFKRQFLEEEKKLLINVLTGIKMFGDRLQVFEELMISESNLNTVFENTVMGYMLLDLDGNIITYNRRYKIAFAELTITEIEKGLNLFDILLPSKRNNFRSKFMLAINNGIASEYESAYKIGNTDKIYLITVLPVFGVNGEVVNVNLSVKDISRRKAAELEQKKISNDLIVRNRDLEQFSFLVSHNLRAPVVNVVELCNQLQEPMEQEEYNYVLSSMKNSVSRIEAVVNDMNTILMVKSGERSEKSLINLESMLDNLRNHFTGLVKDRNLQIHTNFETLNEVFMCRPYLESVFYNLISNAVKYAKPVGNIQIDVCSAIKDKDFYLHIVDNGLGIDMEKHGQHLFLLYKRFHNHVDGKGMGLYMVKTQVHLMQGEISVSSSPGKGSKFTIRFDLDIVLKYENIEQQ